MRDTVFPIVVEESSCVDREGLTKRELFAAMAVNGMCANSYYAPAGGAQIARMAVECADALIAELNASEGDA